MLKKPVNINGISSFKLIKDNQVEFDFTEQVKVIKGVVKLLVHDGKKDLPAGLYKVLIETSTGISLVSDAPLAIAAASKPTFQGSVSFALNEYVITPKYDARIEYPQVLSDGTAVDGSFLHLHLENIHGFSSIYLTLKKTDFRPEL